MIGLTDDKSNNLHATINGVGTVNHLIAKDNRDQSVFYEPTVSPQVSWPLKTDP